MTAAHQRPALEALPPKRRAFVLAFVSEARGNATAAARSAGYACAKSQGSRVLTFAGVRDAIAELRAPEDERAVMSSLEIKQWLSAVARGEVLEAVRSRDGTSREVPPTLTVRLRALEILARIHGMFVTRHDVRVAPPVTLWIVSEEDARARLDRLQAKLAASGESSS